MTDEQTETRPAADHLVREIRRLRSAAGLSQSELARRIGYTRNYVSLAEREGRNLPSRELVDALDRGLHTGGDLRRHWEAAKQEQAELRRENRSPRTAQLRDDAVRVGMTALRRALLACDEPDDGPVRPAHALRAAVSQVTEQRVQARYAQLVVDLPDLLMELGGRATWRSMNGNATTQRSCWSWLTGQLTAWLSNTATRTYRARSSPPCDWLLPRSINPSLLRPWPMCVLKCSSPCGIWKRRTARSSVLSIGYRLPDPQ